MFVHNGFDSERFKNPSRYTQNLILKLEDDFFSSNDGDIEQSGVEFDDYFTTATDLHYGETPASSIRFTLINNDQMMRSVRWGECKAYIGYFQVAGDIPFHETTNSEIYSTFVNRTLSAEEDGFYIEGVKKYDGEAYSIIETANGTYVFGDGYTVMTNDLGETFTDVDASRFMIAKMRTPRAIEWKEDTDGFVNVRVCVKEGEDYGLENEWCYVPMGVYYLQKPKGLNDFTVSVTDAIDRMRLFDVDATDFYKYMASTYPSDPTIKQWFDELIAWVGVQTGYTASGSTTYNYNPSNVGTLRDLLNYLAEKFRGNFRFDRNGILQLYRYGETVVEEVTTNRIEESSLEVAEYSTRPVNKIVVKNLAGLTYVVGRNGDNIYPIYGNPFIQDSSGLTLTDYAFFPYVPVSCVVLEANPCVDVGDKVDVYLSDEDYHIFIDSYNRALTDENGIVFAEENTPLAIPLMHRTMVWNGVCTATYEATGNATREIPSELEQINYNANIANDTDNIINKIVAHGIEVDWIRGRIDNNDWGIDFTNGTFSIGTLTVDEIRGNMDVDRIDGNIPSVDGWGIDFTTGSMSIGTLRVGSITGSLTTTSTASSAWGIDFTNGTMNIGTLAVSKITGTQSLGNNWSIDFDNGTMTIGNLSANNITAGTITAAVTATNFTMSGGSINVATSSATLDKIALYYNGTVTLNNVLYYTTREWVASPTRQTTKYTEYTDSQRTTKHLERSTLLSSDTLACTVNDYDTDTENSSHISGDIISVMSYESGSRKYYSYLNASNLTVRKDGTGGVSLSATNQSLSWFDSLGITTVSIAPVVVASW